MIITFQKVSWILLRHCSFAELVEHVSSTIVKIDPSISCTRAGNITFSKDSIEWRPTQYKNVFRPAVRTLLFDSMSRKLIYMTDSPTSRKSSANSTGLKKHFWNILMKNKQYIDKIMFLLAVDRPRRGYTRNFDWDSKLKIYISCEKCPPNVHLVIFLPVLS